jgi:tetratricopeptide (TPR) repeat protein
MLRFRPLMLSLVALALLALPCSHAGAIGENGYRTGGAHDVMVTTTPTEGLEVGIPRNSWYSKGIALDMQEKWDESFKAYDKARKEFSNQLKRRPRWEKMVRGWKLKAEFQLNQSRQLLKRRTYRWRSRRRRMNLSKAMAIHNKWLGIRAFTGQSSPKLRDKVIGAYKELIRRSSYDDRPKIRLGAMYHEIGKHDEGRRWFAKARYITRTYMAQQVAYYYTAAGEIDKAFKQLERAVKYSSSNRRKFLMSNDLDRLRSDARFRKLVGEP